MTEDILILGELIAEQAAHMDAAEHRLLTNIREFDRLEGWASALSCAHWLAWRVGWTLGTAREHVRVAKALGTLPNIDEALRVGKVSYSKVRAMTRVATPANEQVLLMDAQLTTGSQLERVCRKYRQLRRNVDGANPKDDDLDRYLRWRDLDNGMVSIQAVCHPEEAALIWAAIEQATKELYAARHAALSAGYTVELSADVSAETSGDHTSEETSGECESAATSGTYNSTEPSGGCDSAERSTRSSWLRECAPMAADATGEMQNADSSTMRSHGDGVSTRSSSDVSEETCDVAVVDDDDVDSYEADCAFYERFGVCPEPDEWPRARSGGPGEPTDSGEQSPRGWASAVSANDACGTAPAPVAPRPQFSRIDGLLALVRRFACGESSKTPVEIVVTVSADALKAGGASPDECVAIVDADACIPAETARRLSCDAGIVHMVEDANGNPLSVGRRTRSIPTSIRRALLKRDQCCRFPGCTNRLYVDGHHIEHWADGGETALPNLVLLCGRHHKFVHEYGYRIEVDGDGEPHFFDPRGQPAKDVPSRIMRDDLGWPHIEEANRELGIEAHVCGWTGEPIHYDDVCHALYRVDEGLLGPDDLC